MFHPRRQPRNDAAAVLCSLAPPPHPPPPTPSHHPYTRTPSSISTSHAALRSPWPEGGLINPYQAAYPIAFLSHSHRHADTHIPNLLWWNSKICSSFDCQLCCHRRLPLCLQGTVGPWQ